MVAAERGEATRTTRFCMSRRQHQLNGAGGLILAGDRVVFSESL